MSRIAMILRFLLVETILISFVVLCLGICAWLIPEPYRIFFFPLGGFIGWFLMHISHSKSSRFKPYCDRIVLWTIGRPKHLYGPDTDQC